MEQVILFCADGGATAYLCAYKGKSPQLNAVFFCGLFRLSRIRPKVESTPAILDFPVKLLLGFDGGQGATPAGEFADPVRVGEGDTCAQFDDREVVYSENGAFATTSAKLGDV